MTFTVNERGNAEGARIVKSSHPDFEAPTLRAVGRWRFEPGRKDGKRVKFRMSVPVGGLHPERHPLKTGVAALDNVAMRKPWREEPS